MRLIFKLFVKLLSLALIFSLTMGIGLALYASTLLKELPTVDEIRKIPLNIPLRIYSSDQKLIAEYGNERRIPLSLDDTPPLLIDAILATEDDRFYHHTGVDFPGLARAAYSNIVSRSKGQGASTITMQVARNFFLNPEKTYARKLKEILLAFNMERALTKDEILELYLNKIFLGHRSYGFAAAAQVYYGEELKSLSVPEIAMLAGLPKAPSRDNPISNPSRAKERRSYVLKRLFELERIDALSYETADAAPITAKRHIADVDLQAPYVSEMARQIVFERFGDEVYEKGLNVTLTINSSYQASANAALRRGLLDYDLRHGYRGPAENIDLNEISEDTRVQKLSEILQEYPSSKEIVPAIVIDVFNQEASAVILGGEKITIPWSGLSWAREFINPNSMGPELTSADEVLQSGDIIFVRPEGDDLWSLTQIPEVSGALVSLNPDTGAILALTGGFDYFLSKFNRATQAERQPGSNIKPFIYSAALDNGFTPGSLVSAAPIVIEDDLEGVWRPQNYSKKFFGPTRLRKALSLSLNLVSVRLLRAMGIENTVQHLAKFGFNPDRLPRNLSLALGSTSVTPLELASYFSVFANGGFKVSPYIIEKIEDKDGLIVQFPNPECSDCESESDGSTDLASTENQSTETGEVIVANLESEDNFESDSGEKDQRAISAQNAFLMQSMLHQVILSGTGRRALALGRSDLAGKTGTTNDYRDAWFSGFSPDIMTTVFVGYDDPAHLGRRESGASAALPIWVDYMAAVLPDFPEQSRITPENITSRFINEKTGQVTSSDDPDGYNEFFVSGTEPVNIPNASDGSSPPNNTESVTESLF